ncbi:putative cytochrome p450 protein [Rosellinia necatrix]|uniref:Putative cytochrome p450 protein n=1 Tax=Rosellinia necatrix TaxID=77044 RepID=A0A1S8A8B1_ROSNE|nr:putative cytochrome p450 protein [Rosellinia necatrix]
MDATKEQRMKTIEALLSGYGSLSVARLLAPLAPGFRHQTLPARLGMPARGRDAFAEHARAVFGAFDAFEMAPRAVVDDAGTGVVAIEAEMVGTLKKKKGEQKGGGGEGEGEGEGGGEEWRNECVLIVTLTADGTQVLEVREFVDSAKAVEMAREHAPEGFEMGGDFAAEKGGGLDAEGHGGHGGWWFGRGAMDSDLWIYCGAAALILVGVHRILSYRGT